MLKNMTNIIIPMIYLEESAFIDEDTRSDVMRGVSALHNSFILAVVTAFFGIVFLMGFAILVILEKAQNSVSFYYFVTTTVKKQARFPPRKN